MLVNKHNFDAALKILDKHKVLGFDTETTSLHWWDSPWHRAAGIVPEVFSMQFATGAEEFYFDFRHDGGKLSDMHFVILADRLFADPERYWAIANAKFDMHHSKNHGIEIAGIVHCTKAVARIVNNLEESLKLDDLGSKYIGRPKLDVMTILKERGHFTKVKKFGYNDKYDDCAHFDRLTLNELVPCGETDTKNCLDLMVWQLKRLAQMDADIFEKLPPSSFGELRISNVLKTELELTKILYKTERTGIKIDRAYTEEAYENEVKEYRRIEGELNAISTSAIGQTMDWNSPKQLKKLFDALGEPYAFTEKGNACFDRNALEDSDAEVAKKIIQFRYHYKRAHTYFENFIWLADSKDVLHADAQQPGTNTGRMSYWTPNLQNIPKRRDKEESNYKVRRCFIPFEGGFFADLDFKGAEYYMSMDYAKELPIIEELKTGLDPHARLAKEMNIAGGRDPAKTMQFRILYGGGGEAVGRALGYKGADAKKIGNEKKKEYFQRLPTLAQFMKQVEWAARTRGYIFNWCGRVLFYDRNTAYKSFNGLIQSGVGDMTKKAMVEIEPILEGKKSTMLLQVHDAILLWIAFGEEHLIPQIQSIMAKTYPARLLPMTTDAGFSAKCWSTLDDEIPTSA